MIDFILGETKYVKFAVRSRKQEPFSVRSASWELYHNGLLECSGDCEIEKRIRSYICRLCCLRNTGQESTSCASLIRPEKRFESTRRIWRYGDGCMHRRSFVEPESCIRKRSTDHIGNNKESPVFETISLF